MFLPARRNMTYLLILSPNIPADLMQQPKVGCGEEVLCRAIPARRHQQRPLGSEGLELLESVQEERPAKPAPPVFVPRTNKIDPGTVCAGWRVSSRPAVQRQKAAKLPSGLACWMPFTAKRRLVDTQLGLAHQPAIGGDMVAFGQEHHITRNQFLGQDALFAAIAPHARVVRQQPPQRRNRLLSSVIL